MDIVAAISTDGIGGLKSGTLSFASKHAILKTMFSKTQQVLDSEEAGIGPVLRVILADGIQVFAQNMFTLEGDEVIISVFLAFFKRCTLLWKLLLKEGSINQRLLLKLDYSQKLTSRIFNESNQDMKLSLGGSTDTDVFILDLCVSTLQILPGT